MDKAEHGTQVEHIREVFKYARRFTGKRFVIQISSVILEDESFPSLIKDLAVLHDSGVQIILVPGASQQINTILKKFDVSVEFHDGNRISHEEHIPFIKMAAFDTANRFMTELSRHQVTSVIGNWVQARALGVVDGVDYQMSGTVAKVNIAHIEKILSDDIIPILPCIGWNAVGKAYNLSSLNLARQLAIGLAAEKLFFISDGGRLEAARFHCTAEGQYVSNGSVTRMTVQGADTFLDQNGDEISAEMRKLISLSVDAAGNGVNRVHLLDGTEDGAILKEVFSTNGTGTMIHVDEFDSIRPMEPGDINEVLRLMSPLISDGRLVYRSPDEMQRQYRDFVVFESDGSLKGCGALHRYENNSGEIAAMAVDREINHLGAGNKILRYLIDQARELQLDRVFALTTQAADWFLNMGFSRGTLQDLPETKRAVYNGDRNSRIYVQDLV